MQLKVLPLEGQKALHDPPPLHIQPQGQPVPRPTLLGAVGNKTPCTFRLMVSSVPWQWCLTKDEPVFAGLTCE